MDDTIQFIIDSITRNPNDTSLGEEIRCLKEIIFIKAVNTEEPLFELLFTLIHLNPNDQELGRKIRFTKDKIIEYMND